MPEAVPMNVAAFSDKSASCSFRIELVPPAASAAEARTRGSKLDDVDGHRPASSLPCNLTIRRCCNAQQAALTLSVFVSGGWSTSCSARCKVGQARGVASVSLVSVKGRPRRLGFDLRALARGFLSFMASQPSSVTNRRSMPRRFPPKRRPVGMAPDPTLSVDLSLI